MAAEVEGEALFLWNFRNDGILYVGWRGAWFGIFWLRWCKKMIYKENTEQKWVCESKDVGFIKNPHFPAVCPQNGISGIRRYKPSFQNLNRRANARRKTQENDNLVTGCIYK